MLINKNLNGDIVEATYKSSNILASKYNTKNKDLTIIFNRGASYTYKEVRMSDYTRFELDESQGKILNTRIKNEYQAVRNSDVNVEELLEGVDKIKELELDNYRKTLTSEMESLVTFFNQSGKLLNKDLDVLISKINKYKEINNE